MLLLKRLLLPFFVLFALASTSYAQCLPTGWQGCTNSDFTNAFMGSTTAATLEYDNWVSGFHASAIRNGDGSFNVWGEHIGNSGLDNHILSPTRIETAYPSIAGTVLKVAIGGYTQMVILTTEGLYSVGRVATGSQSTILSSTVVATSAFTKLPAVGKPIGGSNTVTGLPLGVAPVDVKMMFASSYTLAITTCQGNVWMLAFNPNSPTNAGAIVGDGAGVKLPNQWYQVKTAAATPLANIVAARGNGSSMIALDANNNLWTWGRGTFLGDGSVATSPAYAVQMSKNGLNGATIKMIGATCPNAAGGNIPTFYVLATNGYLYALGGNLHRQLGNWDAAGTTSTSWVRPRYESATGPEMNNIKWISPQEHYTDHSSSYGEGSASINVLTTAGILYNWGYNRRGMLGRPRSNVGDNDVASNLYNPAVPVNAGSNAYITPGVPNPNQYIITAADTWNGVETGGHTSMAIRTCERQLVYGGHYIGGSMGNAGSPPPGQIDNDNQFFFTKVNTPTVAVCNAEAVTLVPSTTNICNTGSFSVEAYPNGGSFTVLSGNAQQVGATNVFTPSGTGSAPVVIQYEAPPYCGSSSQITLVKKDFGNLPATTWPVAAAHLLAENTTGVWLGGTSSTTGMANTDCATNLADAADGLTLTKVGSTLDGDGSSGNPWQMNVNSSNDLFIFKVTVNGAGGGKPVYWGIWFDANDNGSFTDDDDVFATGTTSHGSPAIATHNFTLKTAGTNSNAAFGKIRVIATAENPSFTKNTNGTGIYANGEVEDYYVEYLTVLPVKLLWFNARWQNGYGQLEWSTGSELNNKGFYIEKSVDGTNWSTLDFVTPLTANSGNRQNYSYTDKKAAKNTHYYRIRQIDVNGKMHYSEIVRLAAGANSTAFLAPNPASHMVKVWGAASNSWLTIINAAGVCVRRQQANATNTIDISGLAMGVYLVRLTDENNIPRILKFVRQ